MSALAEWKKRCIAAEKRLEEAEHAMHMRIRAEYDKTVADCWRAEVEKKDARIRELEAALEHVKADLGARFGDHTFDGPCDRIKQRVCLKAQIDFIDAALGKEPRR